MSSGTDNFNRIQDTTQLTVSLGNLDSGDTNQPYNYLEWKKRAGIIKPDQLFNAYNDYVRTWYNKRNVVRSVPSSHVLKQEYIKLLKQLTLSFTDDEETRFLTNLDYDNDVDLAIAVPYFARQLKQVVIYLAQKRETAKATKLKYSMTGTSQAIEKVLYQHLLTAFTKKKYATRIYDPEFYAVLPQLSAVNSYLSVEVEELYDESNYFDRDTAVSLSAYTANNDFEFVNAILTSAVVSQLEGTSNYSASATDIQEKYLGVMHLSVSADAAGDVSETTLFDPDTPYAHSSNRYFPTVASVPNINSVKSQAELGGFFTFKSLGVSTYLAATKAYDYNLSNMAIGVSYNIPDPLFINHGRSLTLEDQVNVVVHHKNLDWVKAQDTNGYQEGSIVGARNTQKFIPYQSRYETIGFDTQGVARTTDRFDFWTGEFSDIWSDQTVYPLNWRNEFNIDARSILLQVTDRKLYNWATDIFGNHFAVYKDFSEANEISDWGSTTGSATTEDWGGLSAADTFEDWGDLLTLASVGIYEKRGQLGEIWVRTANNAIEEAPVALAQIYNKYATINPTIYDLLNNNIIRNLDIVQDTLIIEISNFVLIEHIDYDYDTGTIIQGVGGGNIIPL